MDKTPTVAETRTVHLPLAKLEKCATCHSTESLRLCSACGERTYCSSKCQKEDWPKHKANCSKTDRIDLDRFYPFLACMADFAHLHPDKPLHPGAGHVILNAPNPGSRPVAFPDGSAANLVILGDPIDVQSSLMSPKWWPSAASDKVRGKMFRRIYREGYVLPIAMSICLALLSEIYTTTNSPGEKKRARLTYKSSPIADFGVVAGSADVTNQDKLAYWKISESEESYFSGQDPNDHYWMYFTTIRGETVLLDCAMFTFNMCMMIDAEPYLTPRMPHIPFAPALFRERNMASSTPELYVERTRASVLRNPDMHRAVAHSLSGYTKLEVDVVCQFMSRLARRELSDVEIDLTFKWNNTNSRLLAEILEQQAWKSWPAEPRLAIEKDPDEVIHDGTEDDEAWLKYLKKVKKSKKAGADKHALNAAFRKWEARNLKQQKP
ncbi:hypothetical protein GGX14DRAFT_444414 [Mycena pura]|uniref:MYND-type domain-containing protein n=1 Tax=Mycena pura TaxID=153505 RepID=A0AAD6YCN8_9AGAR|nr:hypothetical protein GGX14DRAFT_444414 [Mycena pura]